MKKTHLITMLIVIALLVAAGNPLPGILAGPGAVAPDLGAAESFVALASSTLTNTGLGTFYGDVGVSPGTEVVGILPSMVINGAIHIADTLADQAQTDANTAYNMLAGQACGTNLTDLDLGGMTLQPGVYCFDTSAQLTGALVLDAMNNPDAVWVFQIGSTLTTASASTVTVINGGNVLNAFWQVSSSATLGTGTCFKGNILAYASITLDTGASLTGRALSLNGAVTMDTNGSTIITRTPLLPIYLPIIQR